MGKAKHYWTNFQGKSTMRAMATLTLLRSTVFALTILVILADAVAAPQEPSQAASSQRPYFDEIEITGTVVEPDGAAGASISTRIFDAGQPAAKLILLSRVTDDAGKFSLRVHRNDLAGIVLVAASKDERSLTSSVAPFGGDPAGAYWKNITLRLSLPKEVKGKVVDNENRPIAGAKGWLSLGPRFTPPKEVESDTDGNFLFLIPVGSTPHSLVVFKEGIGIDYLNLTSGRLLPPKPDDAKPDETKLLEFRLGKVVKIPVRVVDQAKKPVSGVAIYPSFKRPGKDPLNLSEFDFPQWLAQKSDDQGQAVVLAANDVDEPVVFGAKHPTLIQANRMTRRYEGGGSSPMGDLWNPADPQEVIISMLDPATSFVTLRGRVVDQARRPVSGAAIDFTGQGVDPIVRNHYSVAHSDESGNFSLQVAKNMLYLVVAETEDHRMFQRSLFIGNAAPRLPIDFEVQPTKKVRFRVLDATKLEPIGKAPVMILLTDKKEYHKRFFAPREDGTPGPLALSNSMPMFYSRLPESYADEEGNATFHLPPGTYEAVAMVNGLGQDQQPFRVSADTDAVDVDLFTNVRNIRQRLGPLPLPFKATFVDRDGKAVGDVAAQLESRIQYLVRPMQATSDSDGTLQMERDMRLTMIFAASPDGALVAIKEIRVTDEEAKIVMVSAGKVTGRLVDAITKEPLVANSIELHTTIFGNNPTNKAAASFVTDSEGRFEFLSVAPEHEYRIWLKLPGPRGGYKMIYSALALEKPGEALDLKDVHVAQNE
jgi:hypothetical protein